MFISAYFKRIKKHRIPISWAQWFWTHPSGGRSLTHEPLTNQSCINGLSVPSATLWCSRRSIRRLSDRDLTRERIFYSANFALRVLAKNRIRFHSEWNRESFKMNVQRIQLNLSPTFSGLSDRDLTRERMFYSANLFCVFAPKIESDSTLNEIGKALKWMLNELNWIFHQYSVKADEIM